MNNLTHYVLSNFIIGTKLLLWRTFLFCKVLKYSLVGGLMAYKAIEITCEIHFYLIIKTV